MRFSKEVIKKVVCGYYDINQNSLSYYNRKKEVVRARHMYLYFCCIFTTDSLVIIGSSINRDHATVIHAKSKMNNEIDRYQDTREEIEDIKIRLDGTHSLIVNDIDLLQLAKNYTKSFIITTN